MNRNRRRRSNYPYQINYEWKRLHGGKLNLRSWEEVVGSLIGIIVVCGHSFTKNGQVLLIAGLNDYGRVKETELCRLSLI